MDHTNPEILSPLTDEEKESVTEIWKPVLKNNLKSFKELALFKHFRGFDSRYVSHYMYLPILAHKLNNYHYTTLFEHKSLLGKLSGGVINCPVCFVRNIDGEYYDNDMRQLTEEQAIGACLEQETVIIKDSTNTSGGMSFEKLELNNTSNDRFKTVQERFRKRKNDFVVQELIKQHPSFARFNPSSLNTLRVTTLYLNGRFSTLSIALRMGMKGMEIDNWGGGGIMVGVNPNGTVHNTGYDNRFNRKEVHNGIVFHDTALGQIPELLNLLENIHTTQFSLCKLIGWDIAYDEDNNPVIIELNSSQPGIIAEQVCTGPIFGDRTEEVIRYCADRRDYYNRSLFNY